MGFNDRISEAKSLCHTRKKYISNSLEETENKLYSRKTSYKNVEGYLS